MLLELCRTNKGVYIKIGQHIGALENLFPKEYTDTLKVLHSQAPVTPLKQIYRVIKEDLHVDVRSILLCIFYMDTYGNFCICIYYINVYLERNTAKV